MNRSLPIVAIALLTCAARVASGAPIGYSQINLTSDVPGFAAVTDPNLRNPWGMSFSATSPFWTSDQGSGVATLYNGAGVAQALIVNIPGAPGPTGPTGTVFVGGMGFTTNAGSSATFVFATLNGTIAAWNAGTSAVTQFAASDGAVYTGLAVAGSQLYAADTANGRIDVFNNTFQPTTVSGAFTDPSVAAGFTPYNIQNVGGALYVEYAMQNAPGGFIGVFDTNGNFLRNISDSHLDEPWGVTLASSGFGQFANDLLVGNFGSGQIDAFDPTTNGFLGIISDASGNPIVNSGLWALDFRSATSGFNPNALFFTAGISDEEHGLFGEIQANAVPEPATLTMLALAFGVWGAGRARHTRRQSNPPC